MKLIVNCAVLQVVRSFLNESIYQNMVPLFIGPTVLFVSKESKAKEMLTTLRASPQMTLLGTVLLSICMPEGMLLFFLLQTKIVHFYNYKITFFFLKSYNATVIMFEMSVIIINPHDNSLCYWSQFWNWSLWRQYSQITIYYFCLKNFGKTFF